MTRHVVLLVAFSFFALIASVRAEDALESANDYVKRGMERFQANQIAESIEDFDRAAELEPSLVPKLWQRGISYYYANRFADGRRQFESHKAFNPHDVENATWHFICVAKVQGVEAAREALIEIDTTRDTRVPMAEVYRFYAGQGTPEAIIQAADEADTETARMYAHLYLGLYYEAAKDAEKAREHMLQAAAAKLVGHYMHDVAKIHVLQRDWDSR